MPQISLSAEEEKEKISVWLAGDVWASDTNLVCYLHENTARISLLAGFNMAVL